MRILIFVKNLDIGGLQRVAINLANYLAKKHSVHVVLVNRNITNQNEIDSDITIHELSQKKLRFNLMSYHRIKKRIRPDVIISFQTIYNLFASLEKKIFCSKIPIIATEHDEFLNKIQNWNPIYRAIFQYSFNEISLIIAPSVGLKNEIVNSGLINDLDVEKIGNPVVNKRLLDYEPTGEFDYLKNPDEFLICGGGRLTSNKNISLLIRAFQNLKTNIPCKLVIFGDGPEKTKLVKLVQELNLNNHVEFLGFVYPLYEILHRADIYVHTAQREAFGNVIVESLALATPIVAIDCPHGPREILDAGKYGNLVTESDDQELATKIVMTLSEEWRATDLKNRASEYMISNKCKEYEEEINKINNEY
jgi:glycosyltransferase involved in cell wall biosynthesis